MNGRDLVMFCRWYDEIYSGSGQNSNWIPQKGEVTAGRRLARGSLVCGDGTNSYNACGKGVHAFGLLVALLEELANAPVCGSFGDPRWEQRDKAILEAVRKAIHQHNEPTQVVTTSNEVH